MTMGRNRTTVFKALNDRIEQKLQGLTNKSLSNGFKVILLKAAAQSILIILMNLFLVPNDTCEEIQRKMNRF